MQASPQDLQKEIETLRENLKEKDLLVGNLQQKLQSKDKTIEKRDLRIEKLLEEIRLQILGRFGRKSEVYHNPNQMSLFDEAEVETDKEVEEEQLEVPSFSRKRGKRKPLPSIVLSTTLSPGCAQSTARSS